MIQQRHPELATTIVQALSGEGTDIPPLFHELSACRTQLVNKGFVQAPNWQQTQQGIRPPRPDDPEPGEWQHG